MVLISIVAVWLAVALLLGVTIGRSIRRADAAELGVRAAWDAGRSVGPLPVPAVVGRHLAAHQPA